MILNLIEDLPKIERIKGRHGRRYYIREGKPSQAYPSVTTVLSADKVSRKALFEWRNRVGAEEAQRVSSKASGLGNTVHDMIEKYVLEGATTRPDAMPIHLDMFGRLKDVVDERVGEVRLVEGQMISDHLRVAGTADMIAEFDGRLAVVDWKTSAKEKPREWITNYFKQEAAYAVMFEENTGIPVDRLVTVITNQEGTAQVFIEKRDDWIGEFLALREQYDMELQSNF